jgi:hypothetical protein
LQSSSGLFLDFSWVAADAEVTELPSGLSTTGERKAYCCFKEADPDIPLLKQAKAEYAKLQ